MIRLIFSVVFLIRMTGAFSPLSFHHIELVCGPHSEHRFENHVNAILPRFNSRFWNLVSESEGIDVFVMN